MVLFCWDMRMPPVRRRLSIWRRSSQKPILEWMRSLKGGLRRIGQNGSGSRFGCPFCADRRGSGFCHFDSAFRAIQFSVFRPILDPSRPVGSVWNRTISVNFRKITVSDPGPVGSVCNRTGYYAETLKTSKPL